MTAQYLALHQELLRSRASAFWGAVKPDVAPPSVVVSIEEGLQSGVAIDIQQHEISIGQDVGADLVLIDEGIAQKHASVSMKRTLMGSAVGVEAFEEGMLLGGEPVPADGAKHFVLLPTTVQIDEITLRFEQADSKVKSLSDALPKRSGWLTGKRFQRVIMAAVAFAAVLFYFSGVQHELRVVDSATATEYAQKPSAPPVPQPDQLDALVEASIRLGLAGFVRFSQPETGIAAVSGEIPTKHNARWNEFLRWHDETQSGVILRSNVTMSTPLPKIPAVSQIKMTDPQRVKFIDGRTVPIGGEVAEGWVLSAVNETSIDIARGAEVVRFDF